MFLHYVKMKHINSLLIFIAVIGLSACGFFSKTDKKVVEEKLAGQTSFTAAQWSTTASSNDIVVNWLDSFNDSTLSSLVNEAQLNNRNLLAASASVDNARALARQAGASLLPSANISVGAGRTGNRDSNIAAVDSRNIGLQVSWEADLWGRISSSEQAAANSAKAAQADFQFAQHSMAATVAKSYFALLESNRQIQLAREQRNILEETLKIVQVQYDNGIVSSQDLALTKSDIASAREQIISLENVQRSSIRALEVLLGRYPGAKLKIESSFPILPPAPPAGIPSELLERRPDLVAGERRVAAAFNRIDAARVARLPGLSLTGNLGGSSSSLSTVLDPANTTWRLAANLVGTLFDGGARKAQVEAATAEQKQALFNYGQLALTAFQEVETALDQGKSLEQRYKELLIAQEQASQAYKIAQLRHKEGVIALLDLLSIQQRLISANSSLATLDRLQLDQRVDLYLSLGGHW